MRVFFKKMGIENLRFKPAYNPYTEVRAKVSFLFSDCARDRLLTARSLFVHIACSRRLRFSRFIRC